MSSERAHTSEHCYGQNILLKERDWVEEPSLLVRKQLMVEAFASVPFSQADRSANEAQRSVEGESNPPLPSSILEHLVYSLMLLPPKGTSCEQTE